MTHDWQDDLNRFHRCGARFGERMITGVLVLTSLLSFTQARAENNPEIRAQVVVQALEQRTLTPEIPAYGQVIADPTRARSLTTQTGGQVTRVFVEAGQRVHSGQPLLIVQTDPAASLAYQQAESRSVVAQQDLTQKRYLFARQMVTHQDVVAAEQALVDARQRLASLRKIGSNQALQTIKAPENALIMSLPVSVGSVIPTGGALLTLAAWDALFVRFGVEPEEAGRIQSGMRIRFRPVFGAPTWEAADILRVDGQINRSTRLLDVIAKPEQKSTGLIAGMTLEGFIELPAVRGWGVPTEAVVQRSGVPTVFRIVDGRAQAVAVSLGERVGGFSVITPQIPDQLHVGDALVTQGQFVLDEGMAVRTAASANADPSSERHP